jgi:hypothetical protein
MDEIVTPAEAFRMLLRSRWPGPLADEIKSYAWFQRAYARQRDCMAEEVDQAKEAIKLLRESIQSGAIRLRGVFYAQMPPAAIDPAEQMLGELDVFAATLTLYKSPQSLRVARIYRTVFCIRADVLKLLPNEPEKSAAAQGRLSTEPTTQELKTPKKSLIRDVISAIHKEAKEAGEDPPNIKVLPKLVRPRLNERGFDTSFRQIAMIGEEKLFASERRKPGKTLTSEGRRPRK